MNPQIGKKANLSSSVLSSDGTQVVQTFTQGLTLVQVTMQLAQAQQAVVNLTTQLTNAQANVTNLQTLLAMFPKQSTS